MSRLFLFLSLVVLAQGQYYPQPPRYYPYMPNPYAYGPPQVPLQRPQPRPTYGGFPFYPNYPPVPQFPIKYIPENQVVNVQTPIATEKTTVTTEATRPTTNRYPLRFTSTTAAQVTTTAKPDVRLAKPVFEFSAGDVIDYEYIYDTLPEERYRAGFIVPVKVITTHEAKKTTPNKKHILRQEDVKTFTNVQTSKPSVVKETVTSSSIYMYPPTTIRPSLTTKVATSTLSPFTTKKPPVFKPPIWDREQTNESSDAGEDESYEEYDEKLSSKEESTTKSDEVTTRKTWWG